MYKYLCIYYIHTQETYLFTALVDLLLPSHCFAGVWLPICFQVGCIVRSWTNLKRHRNMFTNKSWMSFHIVDLWELEGPQIPMRFFNPFLHHEVPEAETTICFPKLPKLTLQYAMLQSNFLTLLEVFLYKLPFFTHCNDSCGVAHTVIDSKQPSQDTCVQQEEHPSTSYTNVFLQTTCSISCRWNLQKHTSQVLKTSPYL
jgi:hypothetical protein